MVAEHNKKEFWALSPKKRDLEFFLCIERDFDGDFQKARNFYGMNHI